MGRGLERSGRGAEGPKEAPKPDAGRKEVMADICVQLTYEVKPGQVTPTRFSSKPMSVPTLKVYAKAARGLLKKINNGDVITNFFNGRGVPEAQRAALKALAGADDFTSMKSAVRTAGHSLRALFDRDGALQLALAYKRFLTKNSHDTGQVVLDLIGNGQCFVNANLGTADNLVDPYGSADPQPSKESAEDVPTIYLRGTPRPKAVKKSQIKRRNVAPQDTGDQPVIIEAIDTTTPIDELIYGEGKRLKRRLFQIEDLHINVKPETSGARRYVLNSKYATYKRNEDTKISNINFDFEVEVKGGVIQKYQAYVAGGKVQAHNLENLYLAVMEAKIAAEKDPQKIYLNRVDRLKNIWNESDQVVIFARFQDTNTPGVYTGNIPSYMIRYQKKGEDITNIENGFNIQFKVDVRESGVCRGNLVKNGKVVEPAIITRDNGDISAQEQFMHKVIEEFKKTIDSDYDGRKKRDEAWHKKLNIPGFFE